MLTSKDIAGLSKHLLRDFQFCLHCSLFAPSEASLQEAESVLRIIRRKVHGLAQVETGVRAAADTRRPTRRFKIQQPERPMRPGVIETRVKRDGRFEFRFHLLDQPDGAERFCPGRLAEIQGQVVVCRRGFRIASDCQPTSGNTHFGKRGPVRVVRGELRPVKRGPAKLPRRLNVRGRGAETLLRLGKQSFGAQRRSV